MNTTKPTAKNSEGHKSPEKLEREVDQVRARLGRTVDELSYRLSPGELLDQALQMVREHGGEFGRNLATQVKNNPMPLLLTGVGLSWLMFSPNKPASRYSYPEYGYDDYLAYDSDADYSASGYSAAEDSTHYADESQQPGVKKKLDDTVERTRRAKESMKQSVHDVSDNVRSKVRTGSKTATHLFEEHPLISGSLGVALGAALGALMPSTRTEDRLLGNVSDQATRAATSVAREQYEKARDQGKEVAEKSKEAWDDASRSAC